ncbi:uncharacterized protein LOC62_02G003454 [Vanrija pseudolonga]|uniref:Uncharacterized protein n=1 Tax=Vanrija pseudolonga TaxID=143232 RepID=A0AAF0Y4E8_9TREE|nr:hypothetical protein LOC62_02G003454 [Vanrija pseudolonga]
MIPRLVLLPFVFAAALAMPAPEAELSLEALGISIPPRDTFGLSLGQGLVKRACPANKPYTCARWPDRCTTATAVCCDLTSGTTSCDAGYYCYVRATDGQIMCCANGKNCNIQYTTIDAPVITVTNSQTTTTTDAPPPTTTSSTTPDPVTTASPPPAPDPSTSSSSTQGPTFAQVSFGQQPSYGFGQAPPFGQAASSSSSSQSGKPTPVPVPKPSSGAERVLAPGLALAGVLVGAFVA